MEKKLLFLFGIFLVVGFSGFVVAGESMMIIAPANFTNLSTSGASVLFNVSFVNGTDITIPSTNASNAANFSQQSINASFYLNGTLIGNSSNCSTSNGSVASCWGYINLSAMGITDGIYFINATIMNSSLFTFANSTSNGSSSVNKSVSNNVTLDYQPAGVTFVTPLTGQNLSNLSGSGLLRINVSVSESSPVNAVYINVTNSTGGQNGSFILLNHSSTHLTTWNFTVNLTMFSDGVYNFTAWVNNSNGKLNNSEIAFSIRIDNVKPVVQESNIASPKSNSNFTGIVVLNVTITDASAGVGTVFFNVTNSSGKQNGTYTAATLGSNAWNATLNTADFVDGTYNITVWANDTAGNLNATAFVYTIVLDNTGPALSVSSSSSTTTTATINLAVTDATSGMTGYCTSGRSGAVFSSESAGTQKITETSLTCNTAYSYVITCTDYAGKNSSLTQAVTTSSCGSGNTGGSGSSGGSTTFSWSKTIDGDNSELSSSGVTQELGAKQKVSLLINGEQHHVGVKSLTTNSVVVEISSVPKTVTLGVGEETKVDLESDGTYDIYVKLNSVASSKASLEIRKIAEVIPESESESEVQTSPPRNDNVQNSPSIGSVGTKTWMWVVGAVIIIIIAIVVAAEIKKKNRKKMYGFCF